MKRNFALIFFTIFIIVLSSCSTGKNALKKGDYYEATIQSVNRLRSNPDSKNARETIEQSYPMALDYYRQKIDQLSASSSPDKFISIVENYTKLNTLADEISRCPAALNIVKPVVYFYEQLRKAEDLATAEQYNLGVQLLKTGFIDDARLAIAKFEWVAKTKPGYSDVNEKLAEAEELATLKVVIEKLPYMGDAYQTNVDRFYRNFYTDLLKNTRNRFVRFYQPNEAEEAKIIPHQIVRMQFVDFSVGNIYEKEIEKDYTADSVVVGSYKDDKGISHDVIGKVKAHVNLHERRITSKGILEVQIIDYESNSVVDNKKYPGEYVWENDWATFNGDERAVPQEIKKLTIKKQVLPPSPQDLFVYFSDPLGSKATSYLKTYYKKQ
jgi:hypothetical protein